MFCLIIIQEAKGKKMPFDSVMLQKKLEKCSNAHRTDGESNFLNKNCGAGRRTQGVDGPFHLFAASLSLENSEDPAN